MTVFTRKIMKVKTSFLILPLAALLLAGLAFVACDEGSSPTPPTGITGTDEILFDDPQPGVTARVSPGTIALPGSLEGGTAIATLVGMYRDPAGMPVEGLQMNFTNDPAVQVGGVGPALSFNPTAAFTDGNGAASTEVRIATAAPGGSYILVAYTSPASAGPNARGQTTLRVATEFQALRITTSTLGPQYDSIEWVTNNGGTVSDVDVELNAIGGIPDPDYLWTVTGLPANLVLNGNRIQGQIAAGGTSPITVTVTDSVGATDTASYTINAR